MAWRREQPTGHNPARMQSPINTGFVNGRQASGLGLVAVMPVVAGLNARAGRV
jgi:hypothetical protein